MIKYRGICNVIDAYTLNNVINILQNRMYENYMSYSDDESIQNAYDWLTSNDILEYYDEELDEYVEKSHDFDCIIVKNCIDSINDTTNFIYSDIIAVLDENIINIKSKEFEY